MIKVSKLWLRSGVAKKNKHKCIDLWRKKQITHDPATDLTNLLLLLFKYVYVWNEDKAVVDVFNKVYFNKI